MWMTPLISIVYDEGAINVGLTSFGSCMVLCKKFALYEYAYFIFSYCSPSLTSSLEDIAKHIPSLRRDIKDGLLQMLSLILTGRPTQPGGSRLAIQSTGTNIYCSI